MSDPSWPTQPPPQAPGQPPPIPTNWVQPPAGGPAWGAPPVPGYGWPTPPTNEPNAIVALVLAALSFAVCPVVLAIAALVIAGQSSRKIAESHGRLTGEQLLKAARIISWVNIGLYGVLGGLWLVIAAAAVVTGG